MFKIDGHFCYGRGYVLMGRGVRFLTFFWFCAGGTFIRNRYADFLYKILLGVRLLGWVRLLGTA